MSVALVGMLPFWSLGPHFSNVGQGTPVGVFDILLLILIGLSLPDLLRALTGPPDVGVRLAGALLGILFLAFLVRPSASGALAGARALGATCLWMTLRRRTALEARRLVIGVLVAAATAEGLIALSQVVLGRPVGAGVLSFASWPLNRVGGVAVPRGTLQHQAPLAAFSLLTAFAGLALAPTFRKGWKLAIILSITAVPLGITFSRSAVLGLALALVVTVLTVRPLTGTVALGIGALAVGALVPALQWRAGWQNRVDTGVAAVSVGDADLLSSRRLHLARGALLIVQAHPLFGVGPGRYFPGSDEAARAAPKYPSEIVHNLPLFFAAEAGVPAGVMTLVILLGAGVAALRQSRAAFALFISIVPFVALDRLSYDGAQGLAFTAVWLAMVELIANVAPDASESSRRHSAGAIGVPPRA